MSAGVAPDMPPARRRTPRALVVVAALAAAAGCTTAVAGTRTAPTAPAPVRINATSGATATPDSTGTPRPDLAAASRPLRRPALGYQVPPTEAFPEAKRAAERAAVDLTTYSAGTSLAELARGLVADPSARRSLEQAAAPLYHRGATSTGTVVYPQMGGAATDQASVMVVVRQQVHTAAGTSLVQTRTLDVRLARVSGHWHFAGLASAGGVPVARPSQLPAAATAVLDDPRISLPDSARWDIYRGAISTTLLRLMEQIAARTPYAVTVLETGHPYDVFGTSHMSMHSAGRAVDINLLAGRHVIDQHAVGSPAYRLVSWLLAQPEVGQVGSPWDLDGASSRSFTNDVHLDHVHVSV